MNSPFHVSCGFRFVTKVQSSVIIIILSICCKFKVLHFGKVDPNDSLILFPPPGRWFGYNVVAGGG